LCGIVGFQDYTGVTNHQILTKMRDTLSHRGPDDCGNYIDQINHVGLGNRRLAVVELSPLGHQPMSNNDKSIWVTFNGEIYNYMELKQELVELGHSFKGNCDTEVLLHAYEEFGVECVEKFIGMFAIAIWDSNKKKMFLFRDRVGVKPLYYYFDNGLFLFASELKALVAHPKFPKELNYDVIGSYLRYGYIKSPETIFKNTFKLNPGHYLCKHEHNLKEVKYWDINDYYLQDELTGSEEEIAEELESLMIKSFNYRLIADVPVGIFLSGGIDSSLVTALIQKNTNHQQKTFTIGFTEDKFNEATWAKKIADHLETDHTEYYLSVKECLGIVEKLPEIYDEPFGDNSAIPTYYVSKLAKEDVTVALSGDGGDELFGGYKRYQSLPNFHKRFSKLPKPVRTLINQSLKIINPKTMGKLIPGKHGFMDKYRKFGNMLTASDRGDLLELYRCNINKWTPDEIAELVEFPSLCNEDSVESTFKSLMGSDYSTRMMAGDFKSWLPDDILTKVDRASMSVGLESREPFLDHNLAEFSARIPGRLKNSHGSGKYILKKILNKYLPSDLVDRPKKGFTIPLADWLRGELNPLLMDYLNESNIKSDGIFNHKVVTYYLKELKNGSVNVHKLWYLLMFQMWKEKWLH